MSEVIEKDGRSRPLVFRFNGRRRYKVYKHASGYWYADFRDDAGKRVRRTLGVRTRSEAEATIRALDSRGQPQVSGEPTPQAVTQIALSAAIAQYLDHCRVGKLAPGSISRYGNALAALERWAARQGVVKLAEVTLAMLEGFARFRAEEEGCAEKTVYTDHLVLKGFFKYAANPGRRMLASNPALGWSMREPLRVEPYCYTSGEVEKFLAGCREWLRPILTVLVHTGMRIGELINLRWQDVDLDKGMIRIRVREDWRPKGRRDRAIPMHPRVKEVLLSRPMGELVFSGPEGGRLKESYLLACFKADREKLGIKRGTLHTFRHYFISACAAGGVPPTTCMTWVGHRDLETLLHYYHLHEDESRRAMERLAGVGA